MPYGANLHLVPHAISAKTEEELTRMCLLANIINHQKYNFMSPLWKEKQKLWVVWFYADVKEFKSPMDLSEDELKLIEGFKA